MTGVPDERVDAEIARHRAVLARLEAGEPIRVVIGHYDFDAAGILLAATYQERLRIELADGLRGLIAGLEPPATPDPSPAAPAAALTAEGAA